MGNLFYFILVAIIAFAFTAVSIPQIVKVAHVKHLFDTPNSRKATKVIVPTLGGTAIFIGITLGVTLGGDSYPFTDLKFIFASLLVTFFAGIKDDLVGISPYSKLGALGFSIVIIAFFANLKFSYLYGLFGINHLGIVPSTILTFFVGIVIINAFNLIDGIDGLASSIAIQIATVMGIWFSLIDAPEYALLAFSLAGSCLAFFMFNVFGNKNKIFMGDTGSLLIGTMIFVLAIKFNEINASHAATYAIKSVPAVLIGFMAYPLFDVLRVFILRVFVIKHSPFVPDKNHIHHRLLALGLNHIQATAIIFVANTFFIIGSLILQQYLGVLELSLAIFAVALLLSTVLELILLIKKKIEPNDEHQQLFLPRTLINAVNYKRV
ncbi:MAG: glycosyltransferase family 4 protein [Prolixibacteraceae bacterium]